MEAAPSLTSANECIRGIGKDADRLLILVDLSKLITANEIEAIGVA
ncbi:hypothetical protein SDC9_15078 [bioreactor metagenome]|uniref:CheW-like domain-containing protein n=1 Tax=bioreactor metagenome TaxID=1076179 RepID=A0A644TRR8_9ZZZZ